MLFLIVDDSFVTPDEDEGNAAVSRRDSRDVLDLLGFFRCTITGMASRAAPVSAGP